MENLTFFNKKLSWYIDKLVSVEARQETINKMEGLGFQLIIQNNQKAA